ncbi:MAG: hypothetical protein WBV33_11520, partial [Terracidiphilus sp.]
LEVEARDISLNHSSSQPSNFRQDTVGGGIIYSWPHYARLRPYGKFLMSYGSIDFLTPLFPTYTHDTRTVLAPGLGFDYRVYGPLLVRVDYEYQFWQQLFSGTLEPQGFTVGAAYAFGSGIGR